MSELNSKVSYSRKRKYFESRLRYLDTYIMIIWGLLFLVLMAIVILAFELLGRPPPENRIDDQTYSEQQKEIKNSEIYKSSPSMPDLSSELECAEQNCIASISYQKSFDYLSSVRDLDAQEGVWRASHITAKAALIQTLLLFAGTVLLGATLIYTRKTMDSANMALRQAEFTTETTKETLEETKRANIAQLMPYLKIKCNLWKAEEWPGSRQRVCISVANIGKTPISSGIRSEVINVFIAEPVETNFHRLFELKEPSTGFIDYVSADGIDVYPNIEIDLIEGKKVSIEQVDALTNLEGVTKTEHRCFFIEGSIIFTDISCGKGQFRRITFQSFGNLTGAGLKGAGSNCRIRSDRKE